MKPGRLSWPCCISLFRPRRPRLVSIQSRLSASSLSLGLVERASSASSLMTSPWRERRPRLISILIRESKTRKMVCEAADCLLTADCCCVNFYRCNFSDFFLFFFLGNSPFEDTMDTWDQDKLEQVVKQKAVGKKVQSDIVSFFSSFFFFLFSFFYYYLFPPPFFSLLDLQILPRCPGEEPVRMVLGVSKRRDLPLQARPATGVRAEEGR